MSKHGKRKLTMLDMAIIKQDEIHITQKNQKRSN
jgi:hypothetical protein